MSFRDWNPIVKVLLLLAVAVIPFYLFVSLRADDGEPTSQESPIPNNSPDTPLAFPLGGDTTTTDSTTTTIGGSTTTVPAQCSDGKDNDRDGRIDYPKDTGCVSRLDRTEANVVTTTRRPSTTAPVMTTSRPSTTTTRATTTTKAPTTTTKPPTTTQPATTQPATTQPATTQPATTQPATTQPATTQPATTQPEGTSAP